MLETPGAPSTPPPDAPPASAPQEKVSSTPTDSKGLVELTEVEALEIENSILRQAFFQEKVAHAQTSVRAAQEGLQTVVRDQELLFARIKTAHGDVLAGKSKIRMSPDGKSILFEA